MMTNKIIENYFVHVYVPDKQSLAFIELGFGKIEQFFIIFDALISDVAFVNLWIERRGGSGWPKSSSNLTPKQGKWMKIGHRLYKNDC